MESESNATSKNTTVIIGVVVVVLIVIGLGFLMTQGKSTPKSVPAADTKGASVAPQVTLEPSSEPVAPERNSYDGTEKYSFALSYPAAYGYAEIDPASFPGEPKPVVALVFSDTITGEGESMAWGSDSYPKNDPTFAVYDGKAKSLDQWVVDYKKQKDENGATPKVISERSILVSNLPAYEVVTETGDKKQPSYKRVFISFDGKIYALSYYPHYKPGHALLIWNTLGFLKP